MEKIGMIGVGAMGMALLERLRSGGIVPTVYDTHPPSLDMARSLGAFTAPSAAAVGRASTIVDIVVRTDRDAFDCVTGREGLLQGAEAGTLVLLHSTLHPKTTRELARIASQKSVHVMDACMTGVPAVVREGSLSFLVGGSLELVERARPHLLKMGKRVFHMGGLGAGNVAKAVKNLVAEAEAVILHEAIEIVAAAGISSRIALEMIGEVLRDQEQSRFDASVAESGSGKATFSRAIPLVAELARDYGLDLPITGQLAAMAGRAGK
jgi:3-hydroxyisobutyrate dehydrogenase-like beta-hydroxyacid dehydrogenase